MKLSKITLQAIFFFTLTSIFIAFSISLAFQYTNYKNDIEYSKNEFNKIKREEIKREVQKVYNSIYQTQIKIENEVRQTLKHRVNIAHKIATSIYNENLNKISEEQIKNLIVSALKNISYSNDKSYYFINENTGRAILFNKISKLNENTNILNLKDKKGNYLIKKQIHIVKSKQEGFVQHYFIKPDTKDKSEYPKLTYVKNFEPFDWHIGTGEYIDETEELIKNNVLEEIASIRFGKDGYIFVNSINKKALVFDGKKLDKPKDYTNESLFEKQINAIANPEGGYISYSFKKLNSTTLYNKIAFVKEFSKWGWIIGSGVYVDEIDEIIQEKKDRLENTIKEQLILLLSILALLIAVIFFISKKMALYLETNIQNLIKAFHRSAKDFTKMDTDKLGYDEFKVLGKNINKILISRNETHKKLQDYINIVNDNVIIASTNEEGIITDVSEAFCKITNYKRSELIGEKHTIIKHSNKEKNFYSKIYKTILSKKTWIGEIKICSKNAEEYWFETIIQPIVDNNKINGFTAILHDITNKKKIEVLSITDELTQLYNRRYFNKIIEQESNRAKRHDSYFSFLMLDIDYFKNYNDTYGHQQGDKALIEVSNVLLKYTQRASDFAFRLGGEEFGLIFSSKNEKESIAFAEKIRTKIEDLNIEHISNNNNKLTVSIGLVIKKGKDIPNTKTIYKLTDETLYKAKAAGRNNTQVLN